MDDKVTLKLEKSTGGEELGSVEVDRKDLAARSTFFESFMNWPEGTKKEIRFRLPCVDKTEFYESILQFLEKGEIDEVTRAQLVLDEKADDIIQALQMNAGYLLAKTFIKKLAIEPRQFINDKDGEPFIFTELHWEDPNTFVLCDKDGREVDGNLSSIEGGSRLILKDGVMMREALKDGVMIHGLGGGVIEAGSDRLSMIMSIALDPDDPTALEVVILNKAFQFETHNGLLQGVPGRGDVPVINLVELERNGRVVVKKGELPVLRVVSGGFCDDLGRHLTIREGRGRLLGSLFMDPKLNRNSTRPGNSTSVTLFDHQGNKPYLKIDGGVFTFKGQRYTLEYPDGVKIKFKDGMFVIQEGDDREEMPIRRDEEFEKLPQLIPLPNVIYY